MAERQYHLKFDSKNAEAVDSYLEYKRQVFTLKLLCS